MARNLLRAMVGFLALYVVVLARPQASPSVLVLTGAHVIDGVSGEALRNTTVIVREGRIAQVTSGKIELPAGATVLDLHGRWLLPGFIDAHVHFGDQRSARTALLSGVTTARSMGTGRFADVGLRGLHRDGALDLPDVLAAGYHVRPNLAEEFFLDFPQLRGLGSGVKGEAAVRRVVQAMLERKVEVIKVNATERAGLPDTDPRKRTLSDEELVALVDEARKAGVTVAAHAHGDEGAAAAVRAGVKTVEHGTYLSDATLQLMAQRGVCLDPTVATVGDLIDPGGDYDNSVLAIRGRAMLPRLRETTQHALQFGVKVIAGTDTGYGPQSRRRMGHEVIELVGLGMRPMDAIKAATSTAAECLGIGNRTGAIREGLEADLIVVDRDPLADASALLDVLLVINNGHVALNRLSF